MDLPPMSNSAPDSVFSRIRCSRISSIVMLRSVCHDAQSSSQGSYEITALEEIVSALERARLPGPAILVGLKQYLGSGAQFVVHKQDMVGSQMNTFFDSTVAVKQPKFNLNPNVALSLAEKDAQQHLKNIVLEIDVLTRPALRRHPNVVRLLYWSYDHYSTHLPITLVMELALCDLKRLLADDAETPRSQRYHLCAGVAAALDAIHECDLVHGDLKTENVLVFREQGHLVAKLADFGLSVTGCADKEERIKLGGTPGWQAPEVEKGQPLLPQELMKADNYSFGLLCWSVFLGCGSPPPHSPDVSRTVLLARDLDDASNKLEEPLYSTMKKALPNLLLEDLERRPRFLRELFHATALLEDDVRHTFDEPEQYYPEPRHAVGGFEKAPDAATTFIWEVPSLPHYFMNSLCTRLMTSPEGYPAEIISALFLFLTHSRFKGKNHQVSALDVFLRAALHGCKPLYEIVLPAFAYYEEELPDKIKLQTISLLEEAVSTGSVLGKRFLQSLSPESFDHSLQIFRNNGGYHEYYLEKTGGSQLHRLASYGSLEQLKSVVKSATKVNIEDRTGDGETPLYLACVRGSWEIAAELLDAGANAAVLCTESRISCLHWIFAFDESVQSIAAKRLVENGADPNVLLSREVPFPQYPFLLPAGTPLHWAVVTGSHSAIIALLEQGADLQIRDGSDPYRYDDRFRYLDKFGGPNQESFSVAERSTRGLSPLDYSVMDFDPFLVEHIVQSGTRIDIDAVDEEGVGVLHRLSANHVRRTRASNTYSFLPFRGSQASQAEQQSRIVSAVVSLGGDLNKLTTPGPTCNQRGQIAALDSYTPLMLAVKGGCASVVKVLLAAGASANFTNPMGNTVLHCLPDNGDTAALVVEPLISAGANIHARGRVGNTALIQAAAYRDIQLVRLLLSHGADIEDTDMSKKSLQQGWNVFEFLAIDEHAFEKSHDMQVAQLLADYVFGHLDAAKSHRVVRHRNNDGGTLLHRFASCGMRDCVSALLQHGAPPNALASKLYWDKDNNRMSRTPREQTPLDEAREYRKRMVQRMDRDRAYSLPEYENICERVDAVIKALEDAGQTYSNRDVT